MKRICTICARGGSKGVKGKNVRSLLGKPLLAHSIEQARASKLFATIAVSSDSDEILEVAAAWNVDALVKRPAELATDTAPKLPVIKHCVTEAEKRTGLSYATMVDLDTTSPLRSIHDIRNAVAMLENGSHSNVITAMPSRRSPYFNLVELQPDGRVTLSKPPATPIVRRQDAPQCFDMNASIYVWQRQALFACETLFHPDTGLYVMPEERSIDIDSELDFEFVEFVMRKRRSDFAVTE